MLTTSDFRLLIRVTALLVVTPVLTVLAVMVLVPPQVIELNNALSADAVSISNDAIKKATAKKAAAFAHCGLF